jgi:ribosomal protein S18 acetylase RimI-like enzyme
MTVKATASTLHIRPATKVDIPRLVQLVNSAFSIETFLEGTRTDEVRLTATMSKGEILLAEDHQAQPLASVYIEVRGDRGYLGMLAVDPAHQGQGLGRLLVEAAQKHLRRQGCAVVDISVLSLRPELLPLYRRFGFVENGMEEFKPSRPLKSGVKCHCVMMSKAL